jgi:lysophospholipase L1-like esterase
MPKLRAWSALLVALPLAWACRKTTGDSPAPEPTTATVEKPATAPVDAGAAATCRPIEESAYDIGPLDTKILGQEVPLPPIVDDAHDMDSFYARLARLVRGKAKDHVRIAVYGDSNMTMDFMSGAMRRLFQGKFGDGGHGYIALAQPWPWYRHLDVKQDWSSSKWKRISTSTDPVSDGHYGAADVAGETSSIGAWSLVGTTSDPASPIGKSVSSIDVFYMKRPAGGSFSVKIDGKKVKEVQAASSETEAGFEHFDVPDGPHTVECVVDSPRVRLFGASLERKTPSVIVDSLGCGALNYAQMLTVSDASRKPMLQRRKYDLIVLLLGTNLFAPGYHEKWMNDEMGRIEGDVPSTPILVMSPPDIELHKKDTHSDPRIVKLATQLAEISKKHGWAFWNFWEAMGGDMSMIRFARNGLGTWDLVHLTKDGGTLMGTRMAHAIVAGFEDYLKAHPDAGCDEDPR